MKKKILFVITKSNWGGAGRYVYDLATALSTDYEVAVALGGSGVLTTKLHAAGINTIPLSSMERDIRGREDSTAFFQLLSVLKKEKPDIVHLNSSKAGGLGALAGRLAGIPRIIFTVHGWAFNEPVSAPSRFFRWTISLITLLLCHKVITVSHFDAVHTPFGLETETIHNGLVAPVFLPRKEARKKLFKEGMFSENAYIVGTIAELTKNKGIDILIAAFAKTSLEHLAVVGEGEERKKLKYLISQKNLENRVHLIGFVDDAAKYLKAFDVFALASRKEGLPYVLLEAGEAEVPVIASTVGGIPEIIDDELSGILVPPYDTDGLADALKEITGSPGARAHYAERLKEKVERYFAFRGMLKKTIEIYES